MQVKIETHGKGLPLVLLHGWGMNGAVWNDIADELAEKFHLHIVDYAGGEIDTLADEIVQQLPAPCHLLGWSLGGQLALTMAIRHPEKISSLILVAATPRFTQNDNWPNAMTVAALDDFSERLNVDYRATIRRFLGLQVLNLADAKSVISRLQNALHARGQPKASDLAAGLEILRTNDMRDVVKQIQHPALIIQGDRDMLTPEAAAHWLAKAMPQSEYRLISGATHAPFLSHRQEFIEHVTRFLKI